MMGAFPMDGPRQPDDAKREALRFAREVCETTRRQTQRPQLRGRLLSLQSFMKLMAGDSCGASADLDASLAAHPDQGVRHTSEDALVALNGDPFGWRRSPCVDRPLCLC